MLHELCAKLGFCLPPDDDTRLVASPPPTIDAFTDEVIRTEGLDPLTTSTDLRSQVRAIVVRYLPIPGDVVVFRSSPGDGPLMDGDVGVIDRLSDDGTVRVVWRRTGVLAVPMRDVTESAPTNPTTASAAAPAGATVVGSERRMPRLCADSHRRRQNGAYERPLPGTYPSPGAGEEPNRRRSMYQAARPRYGATRNVRA